MTPQELRSLIADVNADIQAMTRAQSLRDEMGQAIRFRALHPLEEQLIDEDATGQRRGEPRIENVNGIRLKIWKTHRAGLMATDIKGADLYYETEQGKFALIQYKTPSGSTGRVKKDEDQLDELKAACPQRCSPRRRFSCGSWVAIRDGEDGKFLPACEASNIFGAFASRKKAAFVNGLPREQFRLDFATCHIGGRTKPLALARTMASIVAADHILFEVVEG